MRVTILPTFKGYTVDLQLQKFSKVKPSGAIENIHFLSKKGIGLFHELESFAEEVVTYYDYK